MLGRRLELTGMRADGSEFPVELALSQVEAEPVLICGALRDLSVAKQAESHLRELVEEQAALRRVATLVARESSPQQLFAVVAEQVGRIINVPLVRLVRYESDGSQVELVGGWGESVDPLAIGTRWQLDGPGVLASVWQSGRPARVDDYTDVRGQAAAVVRQAGMRSAVASPISVEGHLWGAISVLSPRHEPLAETTEARLADFTELVATAIANAESRGELAASEGRARKLATEQAALRRVATLVARESSPEEIFAAVAEEVGRIMNVPLVALVRYEPDGSAIQIVGGWGENAFPVPIGTRLLLDGPSVVESVWHTGRPARTDDSTDVPSEIAAVQRQAGMRSNIASPILVEGRLWGAMGAGSPERLPDDIESRLANFTELLATAIANSEARDGLRLLLDEQAALRRVATLVAEGASAEDVFSSVAREVAHVFDVRLVTVCRYESDTVVVLASLGVPEFPAGSRWPHDVPALPATIYETGRPARIGDFTTAAGLDALAREGVTGAVGVPIVVDGSVWGSVNVASTEDEAFAADAEERLARFTELVATAVSNATMRGELAASRARVIGAADESRRRIERDLHDGAQQQLVTLAVGLRATRERVPPGLEKLQAELADTADGLTAVLDELREMSRGIHPAILTEGGLEPALKALARRSAIPVEIDLCCDRRLPDGIEVAAYYVASEALTNAAKHAEASRARIVVRLDEAILHLSIRDDGIGGADASRGSGLIGLRDRVEALGGTIDVASPPGSGTRLDVEIPLLADRSVASNLEPRSRV
jgi:signal transduction histidine kinase